MRIVFLFCCAAICLPASAHILLIGTGSGAVSKNGMTGLKPGDTLAIRAGLYEQGGSFSGLSQITIINYKGKVEFTGTVRLGNLSSVNFSGNGPKKDVYGFRFRDYTGDAFLLLETCTGLSFSYIEYRNLNGPAMNAGKFFKIYRGGVSTLALYKTRFSNQKLVHSGPLFIGSWTSNSSFQNVVDSISFIHIIVDSTSSNVCQVTGHSIYRMLASHWRITGPCPNGKQDAGIFQISGNATVSNVYRNGGWGYLMRIWNLGLNGRADSYLYNCIDLNTDNYGTVDTRIDAGDTTSGSRIPFIRGGNMHVLNNTIGNKKTINYVSQLVVVGDFCARNGYRLEVRNNLCFNTIATGTDQVVKQNTNDALRDTSNNLYFLTPVRSGVLLETVQCMLSPGSPAIDRGRNFPMILTDIDGVPRPTGRSSDIGAREYAPAK